MAEVTVEECLKRIEGLEHIIGRSGLDKAGFLGGALKVIRADKDEDGDFDPYTSSSWDGDSYSDGTGTIDWNADFGVPDSAKVVYLRVGVRDSDSAATYCWMGFKAKSTSTEWCMSAHCSDVNERWKNSSTRVNVAQNGTSYYQIAASGASTFDVYIWVVGYAR